MARNSKTGQHYCIKMKSFSKEWVGSKNPKKQRKYRTNAPLHVRKDFMNVHLSKELREKYGRRSVVLRVGDKIKVLRGQFKKKEGKVERIDRNNEKIFVTGVDMVKKDGTKVLKPIRPSNMLIVDLELGDKKRKEKLEIKK